MKRVVVFIGSIFFISVVAEEQLRAYAHVDWGVNVIRLNDDGFQQSQRFQGKVNYNNSVWFPTLAIDMGIMSGKTFRFWRNDAHIACGVKVAVSNTDKKIDGLFRADNLETPEVVFDTTDFMMRHDFNVAVVRPYVGVMFERQAWRFGATGGLSLFNTLLEKLHVYDTSLTLGHTGISLQPKKGQVLGGTMQVFIGRDGEDWFGGVSYEYTRAYERYAEHIYIERGDVTVQTYLQNLHLREGVHNVDMIEAPTVRVSIHTVSACIGVKI